MNAFRPELLAPAGSLEKLKVAVLYGADAVYLGGLRFGLRAAAENFTDEQLIEGVEFAHERGSKVYVVLNGFLHDEDIQDLPEFLQLLQSIQVDAVIVSDLGAVRTVINNCQIPVHLSTQASCLNVASAAFWKEMGVQRIVLGRESSIVDAARIKREVDIEIEMFVHGSMCMAYSGNCVISNYTQGRDSNRGGCAHSCRFEYKLDMTKDGTSKSLNSYFMSSKDLNGLQSLEQFIDHKIDSLKVEGRMKSSHYAGTISKVYSEALDYYTQNGRPSATLIEQWSNELDKIVHRDYTQANLLERAGNDSIYNKREHEAPEFQVVGVVVESKVNGYALVQIRSKFELEDELELVPFKGPSQPIVVSEFLNALGEQIADTKPGILVRVPYVEGMEKFNIVRRRAQL